MERYIISDLLAQDAYASLYASLDAVWIYHCLRVFFSSMNTHCNVMKTDITHKIWDQLAPTRWVGLPIETV